VVCFIVYCSLIADLATKWSNRTENENNPGGIKQRRENLLMAFGIPCFPPNLATYQISTVR
jgi:hypothetical protein